MKESKLKKRVFIFFALAKGLTILVILLEWQLRAFTKMEMFGTFTLVLPLFMVYLTLMFKQFVQNRYVDTEKNQASKELTSTFRTTVFFVLPIYVLLIIAGIHGKATHTFKYEEMQTFLGLVESGFGVYVAQIVFALFKTDEEKEEK